MIRLRTLFAGVAVAGALVLPVVAAASASAAPAPRVAHVTLTKVTNFTQVSKALRAEGLVLKAVPFGSKVSDASTHEVCLWNSNDYCWKMNGSGTQVTITAGTAAQMTLYSGVSGGTTFYKFADGNNKCLYLNTSNEALMTGSNGCSIDFSADSTQLLQVEGSDPSSFASAYAGPYDGDVIKVFNDVEGKPVWFGSDTDWVSWGFF
jgi:hypothetical protein